MFHNAQNFSVNGGNFYNQQNTYHFHSNNQNGIALLLDASTPEAAVDSVERNYTPRCFPGTREQYIEDITNWATSSSIYRPQIYWMKGPAGVGKSSIAQTSAMKVQEVGCLGAAFFFSINGRRNDHKRLFPSLAHQLSTVLLDYRNIVNEQVLIDSTVFNKTMRAQFWFLIAGPLRKLNELGKKVPRMSIFIDGLDECKDKDAQVEIIEIIAESIQGKSTPFQWAIFSREEPRISSTFDLPKISLYCHVIYLPISRDTDKEIEAYLRGEFKNILRRRFGSLTLSYPWPREEDIRKLVDAAAGLFAFAATIVRFIGSYSHSGFEKALQAVLDTIVNPCPHSFPVFANLDRLYTLILQGVPADITSPTNLLLFRMSQHRQSPIPFVVSTLCNRLDISEAAFKSICCYLHAVLVYHAPPVETPEMFALDLRSYLEQDFSLESNTTLHNQLKQSSGTIGFLHKSFYDFLRDPNRSGSVFNPGIVMTRQLLHHYHQHLRFACLYVARSSRLELVSDAGALQVDPSLFLSWPTGSKLFDSWLALYSFCLYSGPLTGHNTALPFCLYRCMVYLPGEVMEEIDFRKALVALGMTRTREWHYQSFVGDFHNGEGVTFHCCKQDIYNKYGISLLQMALDAKRLDIVTPFRPDHTPSVFMSAQSSSSLSKLGRHHGLHTVGIGKKSVIWYWEYDEKNDCYYEFQTLGYTKAMRIFQSEKYKMWNESWVPPPQLLEENPAETNAPTPSSLASSSTDPVKPLPTSPSTPTLSVIAEESSAKDGSNTSTTRKTAPAATSRSNANANSNACTVTTNQQTPCNGSATPRALVPVNQSGSRPQKNKRPLVYLSTELVVKFGLEISQLDIDTIGTHQDDEIKIDPIVMDSSSALIIVLCRHASLM
ncbi:hypothetical protein NP233_g12211 [Leucocoprinus birnbaumii]|uniref:Nephrocystin 3-like N-terminal domain-containing protein n=1 Tax=Leucocoprinus birnbaumii TaxID=56174 RepID=A0AAD5VET8_9AGAR|nr:hypothetical protein NP233_g12211 [Leucocoprinus birnbaumii]